MFRWVLSTRSSWAQETIASGDRSGSGSISQRKNSRSEGVGAQVAGAVCNEGALPGGMPGLSEVVGQVGKKQSL